MAKSGQKKESDRRSVLKEGLEAKSPNPKESKPKRPPPSEA